jgi:hypothetical protein
LDSKTELFSIFEKFRQALFDCDCDSLRQMIAEDYRGFDPQGQPQGKNMILEAYRPGGVKLDAYDVEELEARIIEPVGIVTGKGRIHGKYADYDFEHLVRFVDLYVQRDGCWQLYYSQVTPLEAV